MQETVIRVPVVRFEEGIKDRQKPRGGRSRINKRKKKNKTMYSPPVTNRVKENVYKALKSPNNSSAINQFCHMNSVNLAFVTAVLNAYDGTASHGDFGQSLIRLQARNLVFADLNAATKIALGELHNRWPGLETLAPARSRTPPREHGSTLSSFGLNALEMDRQAIPMSNARLRGFQVAVNAAKMEAIACRVGRAEFMGLAETLFNTENPEYNLAMTNALANFQEPREDNNEAQSDRSAMGQIQMKAENSLAFWASLFPVSFYTTLREYVFVQR